MTTPEVGTTTTPTFSQDSLTANTQQQREPIQLLRPAGDCYEIRELLERPNLNEQEVKAFLLGETVVPRKQSSWRRKYEALLQAYHTRRDEIRDLVSKLDTGGSRIDEHGRLVPVEQQQQLQQQQQEQLPPPLNPQRQVPLAPPQQQQQQQQPQRQLNPPLPPLPPRNNLQNVNDNNNNGIGDADDAERRRFEQDEREAAEAIARAVQRYRDVGVPEDEFILIRVLPSPSQQHHHHHQFGGGGGGGANNQNVRLTFRRICFAVLAVSTAFFCIMLQTLPLFRPTKVVNPIFDKLMYELLRVRHFDVHAQHCPGLHRNSTLRWTDWLWKAVGQSSKVDCADGVLHIPAQHVLRAKAGSEFLSDNKVWSLYARGVNASWFFPCHFPPTLPSSPPCRLVLTLARRGWNDSNVCREYLECKAGELDTIENEHVCFRGVHDGLVRSGEVEEALFFGAQLIRRGGDHFDIHDDRSLLLELGQRLPNLLVTLQNLLHDTYHIDRTAVKPVAFRVSGAAPMDGTDVRYGMDSVFRVLNLTRYTKWIRKCKRRNELARYAVPWPLSSLQPIRDTCHLMADLDADPDFHILTSVFLSSGAGHEYRGGVSLYVDHAKSRSVAPQSYSRNLVRRGLTIDGSRGRIVVSTGGWENRRCRLPTRAGVRAELQIWWSYQ